MFSISKLQDVIAHSARSLGSMKRAGLIGGNTFDKLNRCMRGEEQPENITLQTIDRLCEYFGCDLSDILEWTPNDIKKDSNAG